jgi:hypothetical protein
MDVIATLFLIFLVAEATIASRAFISRLTDVSTLWPPEVVGWHVKRYGLGGDALADFIDLQYLADRTKCITQLIYLPFVVLALMVLSRNQLFDDFSMSWTLLASLASSLAVIIGSVWAYRSAAEKARDAAREHLTAKIIAAQGDEKTASQLKLMLDRIESLDDGAFAPPMSQPIVKAVLLPLATYGAAWLAHLYGLPGT